MNTTDKYLIESTVKDMPPEGLDLGEYVGMRAEIEELLGVTP